MMVKAELSKAQTSQNEAVVHQAYALANQYSAKAQSYQQLLRAQQTFHLPAAQARALGLGVSQPIQQPPGQPQQMTGQQVPIQQQGAQSQQNRAIGGRITPAMATHDPGLMTSMIGQGLHQSMMQNPGVPAPPGGFDAEQQRKQQQHQQQQHFAAQNGQDGRPNGFAGMDPLQQQKYSMLQSQAQAQAQAHAQAQAAAARAKGASIQRAPSGAAMGPPNAAGSPRNQSQSTLSPMPANAQVPKGAGTPADKGKPAKGGRARVRGQEHMANLLHNTD